MRNKTASVHGTEKNSTHAVITCLYLFRQLQQSDLTNVQEIKRFCEGCSGQNKNVTVVEMLSIWLSDAQTGVQKITMVFPVVGHFFLPAERVLGISKRKLEKTILWLLQEYLDISSEFGKFYEVAVENWKTEVSSASNATGRVAFLVCPRQTNNNRGKKKMWICLQGEKQYRSTITFAALKSISKKGRPGRKLVDRFVCL